MNMVIVANTCFLSLECETMQKNREFVSVIILSVKNELVKYPN